MRLIDEEYLKHPHLGSREIPVGPGRTIGCS